MKSFVSRRKIFAWGLLCFGCKAVDIYTTLLYYHCTLYKDLFLYGVDKGFHGFTSSVFINCCRVCRLEASSEGASVSAYDGVQQQQSDPKQEEEGSSAAATSPKPAVQSSKVRGFA